MEIAYMLIPCIAVLSAYRQGIKDGMRMKDGKEPVDIIKKPVTKPKESKEIKRLNAILANIDSYDGTAAGQKEVM